MAGIMDLSGKVVLVTGGNGGIGLGMAEGVAAAGADVCIWGRNVEKNEHARAQLEKHGNRVLVIPCDVSSEENVEAAFAETVTELGKVDACFANAGLGGFVRSFAQMETTEWRNMLTNNLDSVFFTLRAAVRHMVGRGEGGSLAATSSLAAIEGQARGEHYAATKGAIISVIKALAVEYARDGIRANAILPGWIDTPMSTKAFASEQMHAKVLPRVPVRRWGTGADFAGVAVYLTSDLSSYHTGDTFVIDGGYSIY